MILFSQLALNAISFSAVIRITQFGCFLERKVVDTIRTQAVSFDVGGTLIQPWPSVGAVYASVAADNGYPKLPTERIDEQFASAWKSKAEFQYSESEWLTLVQKSFSGLVSEEDSARFFPAVYRRFEEPDVWKIHEDVIPILDDLAGRGFRLALISNWDTRLRPLLEKLKLISFFETATISSELGFTKPSPGLFEQTLKKLGLPASALVHVGDSLAEDVDGAEAAGITAIMIQRNGRKAANSIGNLGELSNLLTEAW